jgi:hypothetical protein
MCDRRANSGHRASLALAVVGLVGLGLPGSARAADDLGQVDASLKWLPADTAFYGTMLRNREQVEAVLHSRAWAKLTSLPAVREAWQMGLTQLKQADSPFAPLFQLYQLPENRQLVELLADMGSQEVFLYGDAGWVRLADLLGRVLSASQFGPAVLRFRGGAQLEDVNWKQLLSVLQPLSEHRDMIRVPELVIGFKITDGQRAEAQLTRLEQLLTGLAAQVPPLEGRLKRVKEGGGDFLRLSLDGEMIPWQQIPISDLEDSPGQYDALVKKLKGLKLFVNVGVRDGYVLFALGPTAQPLPRPKGKDRLVDRPELQPLTRFAGRRLTSVGYVSRALNARLATTPKDIDRMVEGVRKALEHSGLPDELQERIRKDLAELAGDIKPFIPEPGATLGFSFLTGRGQESYAYDWSSRPGEDTPRPLTLRNHLGGTPLFAAFGRSAPSAEPYRLLAKWLRKANGYVEEFVVPQLGESLREKYDEVAKRVHPLLRRLDEATGKKLLPALADGQVALVLDAKLKSRQWYKQMPPAKEPLPMLEPALVFGVSDAALLREAFRDYRAIVNDAVKEVRQLAPQIPEFEVPEPETLKLKAGTLYYYALPLTELAGIDPKIAPAAGLSRDVLVLALSHQHVERLLERTPLRVSEGPLADPDRPLTAGVYFDWPGLVDAATPWVEFGATVVREHMQGGPDDAGSKEEAPAVLRQVRTVLEVLKVFRGYTSCTYREGGAEVTHGETVVEDL